MMTVVRLVSLMASLTALRVVDEWGAKGHHARAPSCCLLHASPRRQQQQPGGGLTPTHALNMR